MLVVSGTTSGHMYGFDISHDTNTLVFNSDIANMDGATTEWVVAHPSQPVFYVVVNLPGELRGQIFAYRVTQLPSAEWSLTKISAVSSAGRGPCYMELSRDNWLLVANYREGNAAAIRVEADGRLAADGAAAVTDAPAGAAAFPTPGFQDQSYAHCVRRDPYTGRYVMLVDAGLNQLRHYRFERESHTAQLTAIGRTNTSLWRPRHFAWHPTRPVAFVVHELESIVSCWDFDITTGLVDPRPRQHAPTMLPRFFTGYNLPAEVAVNAAGTLVFVTNRGADSIATFSVDEDTLLTPIAFTDAGGRSPRHVALLSAANASGHADATSLALVSNEGTSSIATFQLRGRDGRALELLHNVTNVSGVACTAVLRAATASRPAAAPPTPLCTGRSSNLSAADCASWRAFAEDRTYSAWLRSSCKEGSSALAWRDDPCSCTFRSKTFGDESVRCGEVASPRGGAGLPGPPTHRIRVLRMDGQRMPTRPGIPAALFGLSGLTELSISANQLEGTIPSDVARRLPSLARLGLGTNQMSGSIPSGLGGIATLYRLGLDNNRFSGTVPTELASLTALKLFTLDHNRLSGVLPPLPFRQYRECCRLYHLSFDCPLPRDANTTCTGGELCGPYPPPSCVPS